MKIKENIKLRKIGKEKILIVNDGKQADYTRVVNLNDTAAFLLEQTGSNEFSIESWANILLDEYDIDEETAFKDCSSLIEKLNEAGIIA